jgi:hypothetical protein
MQSSPTAQKCFHPASTRVVQVHPADIEIRLPPAGPSRADLKRNTVKNKGSGFITRAEDSWHSALKWWTRRRESVPLGGVRAGEAALDERDRYQT